MYHNDCFQGQAINPLDTCIDEEVVSIHLFINLRNLRFYLCVVVMVVEVSGLHLCRHAWNSKISKQGLFLVYGLSKQPSRDPLLSAEKNKARPLKRHGHMIWQMIYFWDSGGICMSNYHISLLLKLLKDLK